MIYGGVAERLIAPDLHSGEPGGRPNHPGSVGSNPTTSAILAPSTRAAYMPARLPSKRSHPFSGADAVGAAPTPDHNPRDWPPGAVIAPASIPSLDGYGNPCRVGWSRIMDWPHEYPSEGKAG